MTTPTQQNGPGAASVQAPAAEQRIDQAGAAEAGERRVAEIRRETKETQIVARLDVDGTGKAEIATGIGFLDHMLDSLARHARFDLAIQAMGDLHIDAHHTAEDVAIVLGQALDRALGAKKGLRRFADATVPLDEALVQVVVDLSGRGFAAVDVPFRGEMVGQLPTEMVPHFLRSFAIEGRLTLHARLLAGENDHHRAEATFKALARCLELATRRDPRIADLVPSTKGAL
ncbi:MAG: imidazoleglycerol-phosphate dehydratase HisB [Chloroflexota bacterium]|nr:imidazoleglycerol-phosphate dehydratase HisB [Chloroflexota bacterium]